MEHTSGKHELDQCDADRTDRADNEVGKDPNLCSDAPAMDATKALRDLRARRLSLHLASVRSLAGQFLWTPSGFGREMPDWDISERWKVAVRGLASC